MVHSTAEVAMFILAFYFVVPSMRSLKSDNITAPVINFFHFYCLFNCTTKSYIKSPTHYYPQIIKGQNLTKRFITVPIACFSSKVCNILANQVKIVVRFSPSRLPSEFKQQTGRFYFINIHFELHREFCLCWCILMLHQYCISPFDFIFCIQQCLVMRSKWFCFNSILEKVLFYNTIVFISKPQQKIIYWFNI